MATEYFSDRERGPLPRNSQEIAGAAWGGIVSLIDGYISSGGFGIDFPLECHDGCGPVGTDWRAFGRAARGEIPELEWPLREDPMPSTLVVLDLLEFCYRHAAEPIPGSYHGFFNHHHLSFERDAGRRAFRERANRILSRNQLAYELHEDGHVVRLPAPVLGDAILVRLLRSGDLRLDELLSTARAKFLHPAPSVRREALEKLWDAWERVKTIEPASDKRESAALMLDKAASEPAFRQQLEEEARQLNKIGNTFHIRHSETSQIELTSDLHVDYLFHRLFAFIWLVLRARGASNA